MSLIRDQLLMELVLDSSRTNSDYLTTLMTARPPYCLLGLMLLKQERRGHTVVAFKGTGV